MASSFSQIRINKGMVQMKSDSCTFLKKDHLGHVQLALTISTHGSLTHSQQHRRQRRQCCQPSHSPSATMMLKNNFVSDSDKLQGVSGEFSHLFVKGAKVKQIQFKKIQLLIVVVKLIIMVQMFMKLRERE